MKMLCEKCCIMHNGLLFPITHVFGILYRLKIVAHFLITFLILSINIYVLSKKKKINVK